jgi:hypothetical protein
LFFFSNDDEGDRQPTEVINIHTFEKQEEKKRKEVMKLFDMKDEEQKNNMSSEKKEN